MQTITNSPNIATLDSKVTMDLCNGVINTDISPSVWIGIGENNVLGVKVQITNPLGVIIKPFPAGYDLTPALSGGVTAIVSFNIPTQAGNYQYGKYTISVQLTDADNTVYTDTKSVSICAPNPNDKTKKYGTLGAKLSGVCSDGKVYVLVNEPPAYKGFLAESTSQAFTLDYPTGSGLASLDSAINSFSVQLFEGVYKISGSLCAEYNYGDNVFVDVNYKVNYSKAILCSLDDCCVHSGLVALKEKLDSDCSQDEMNDTRNRLEKATLLIATINFGVKCGQDVSDYIQSLEDVLGVNCSCSFDDGTPIINNNPSSDILVQGCNVEKETVGLTTVYTLNLYSYVVNMADNGGALTMSEQTLNGCVKTQTLTFNIATVYSQIKTQATPADATKALAESNFWAGVVKNALNSINASCLDLTAEQLSALTLPQLFQKIIDKECAAASCASTIDTIGATQNGADVVIAWTSTNAYIVDIYIDNILRATVLSSAASYTAAGYADGITHTYRVISKCSNNIYGSAMEDTFGFTGCPTINPPTVSSASVSNATCPFDLTGLVSGLPAGITAEWHTANNHLASTLVPDETAVSDGIYYVFATNGHNCYSSGVKVTVTCAVASSCTAPQSLSASSVIGGIKIAFTSAAYPPPSNSYTVKRKPKADADIDANYTTIGTPVYNTSTGKYEITDTSAVANTYYTYKAVSNCGGSTPYVTVDFANISCPALTLSATETTISYSFSNTGGEIDKYEVEIWNGATLIHTDTFLPSLVFPDPMTGTFSYLTSGTNYKVRIVPFIGTASFPCAFSNKYTAATQNVYVINSTGATINLAFDIGTQSFNAGINGNIGLVAGGYLKNISGSTYKFTFYQSLPSTVAPNETPNPDTLADGASHTLNADISTLNYVKVELP